MYLSCRLLPVAVSLWNHPTKGLSGVCVFPQNCMNTKDGVESPQILTTAASHGDLDIPRLVVKPLAYSAFSKN